MTRTPDDRGPISALDVKHASTRELVWIPGGVFRMGSDSHYPEEAPAHNVSVKGFYMERHAVTNRDFQQFVHETGYVTLAERPADPDDYPGADPVLLAPSSVVFHKPGTRVDLTNPYRWWAYVPGANWRHPRGADSSIDHLADHPVVHVAYEDVEAYASWSGRELPTEAEWEFAARGGLERAEYAWGDTLNPGGKWLANTWQGEFPFFNSRDDGYEWTAPVGKFPANGYGLYDMIGNVWEWTRDYYQSHHELPKSCCVVEEPRGGTAETSYDPRTPAHKIARKVIKGGSFLCSPNYCRRYRPAARMAQPVDTSTCHVGFRLIVRPR